MRVKLLLLLVVACALALAGCAKTTTTTTNQPAGNATEQTSTTTATTIAPPAATPQAPGAPSQPPPQAVVADGASARTSAGAPDPCRLLTSDEIKAVQGEEIKETKTSQRSDASFAIGQCFYTTATFTKSISLEVTDQSPGSKTSPREFWKENFTRAAGSASEREREQERERRKDKDKDKEKDKRRGGEEEEEGAPPPRVTGIGDEAYWINSRVSGALYVLKGNRFIRVSLGGADDDAARQRKAKTLAQKALARL